MWVLNVFYVIIVGGCTGIVVWWFAFETDIKRVVIRLPIVSHPEPYTA